MRVLHSLQHLKLVVNHLLVAFDILLEDMRKYVKLSGMKASTPHIGWHIAGTNYIIMWWSIQLEMVAIL